jgi:hypothetical protein
MQSIDFFHSRIDAMINVSDPLAALAKHFPWRQSEYAVTTKFGIKIAPMKSSWPKTCSAKRDRDWCRAQQRRSARAADSPNGQPALAQAQLQRQRRRTGGAVEQEHRLAVFQRQRLLRTPPAMRCHPDRTLLPRPR